MYITHSHLQNIRLIDSPGIVFADGDSSAVALRNCVHVESLLDVYTPIQAVLDRCPVPYLMQLYCIPRFKDAMGFLTLVSRATGKLKKGGVPNTDAAARGVLHDWNTGRIKYYCKAPKRVAGLLAGSEIVSGFSAELDLDALDDVRVLDALEGDELCDYVSMDAVAAPLDHVAGEEEERMEVTEEEEGTGEEDTRSRAGSVKRVKQRPAPEEELEGQAVGMRRLQKQQRKRQAKEQRRDATEPYDFEQDFA
jgi:nuclear GTP-binding protein